MFNNITGPHNKFSNKIHPISPIVRMRDEYNRPIENYFNGKKVQTKEFQNNRDLGIYKPLEKNVNQKKETKLVPCDSDDCLCDIIVDDHQFNLDNKHENKIYLSTNTFSARKSVEHNIESRKALEATLKKYVSIENRTDCIHELIDRTVDVGSDNSEDSDSSEYKEIKSIPLEKFPDSVFTTSITSECLCPAKSPPINNNKLLNVLVYEESCIVSCCNRKASRLLTYDSDDAIVRKSTFSEPHNSESDDMFPNQDLECYCSVDELPTEESESIQEIRRLIKLLKETDCSTDIYDKGDRNNFPEILDAEKLLISASQETIFTGDYDKSQINAGSFFEFCKTNDVVHGILFFTLELLIKRWKLKCVKIIE